MDRPKPDSELLLRAEAPFEPSMHMAEWITATFLEPEGPLYNVEHEHLQGALIGVLWAATGYSRHMATVLGQAEIPQFQGNAWTRGRQEQQMVGWFGRVPDFVLTFDAMYASGCDDRQFCALVEHELYHCGQQKNALGGPKFTQDGMPAYGIRAHDVEEFVGVVRRYGATEAVSALVQAAIDSPLIRNSMLDGACGTCKAKL